MQEEHPIIIGLMGLTGTGKSTFIKKLTGDPDVVIGKGLRSCTQEILCSVMRYQSYDVTLVDTPGFDDTDREDSETLVELASWLHAQRQEGVKLAGLIYLHRITDNRMGHSAVRNVHMMRDLVGDNNMKNVVLVTTRWEELQSKESKENCEKVLQNDLLGAGPPPGFWYDMVSAGADYAKHDGSEQSAQDIIGLIVGRSPIYLRIQDEMYGGADVAQTSAGKALIKELQDKIDKLQKKYDTVTRNLQQRDEETQALRNQISTQEAEIQYLKSVNRDELEKRGAKNKAKWKSRSGAGKPKCTLM